MTRYCQRNIQGHVVGSKENPCRNKTQVQFQGQGSGNFDKALQELGEVDQLAEIKANDHQWEGPEAVGQADRSFLLIWGK